MTLKSIREQIYEAAASALGVPVGSLNPDAPWSDYVADSLDVVHLVMAVEEAFDIQFDDEESVSMKCRAKAT